MFISWFKFTFRCFIITIYEHEEFGRKYKLYYKLGEEYIHEYEFEYKMGEPCDIEEDIEGCIEADIKDSFPEITDYEIFDIESPSGDRQRAKIRVKSLK